MEFIDKYMEDCILCNRKCHADRSRGHRGYCGMTGELYVSRAALHMWEEPCISGENGSGTVFFSGCSLRCVFCQNHDIAVGNYGKPITVERLAEIFLELQDKKAHNINLVTPTHYVPHIIQAVEMARRKNFRIPIVYNTGTYDTIETIKMLEGYVDIYMPDMKYMDSAIAGKYSNAGDYFKNAKEVLKEMVAQTGPPQFDKCGMMNKGVLVRHLLLPGYEKDSKNILEYLHSEYGDDIYISIMNQYTPMKSLEGYEEINRKITEKEYDRVVDYAIDIGIENGFIQEGDTAAESFIPDFVSCEGV